MCALAKTQFLSFSSKKGSTYRRDIGSLFETHWEIQRETGNWREFWVHGRFRPRALSRKKRKTQFFWVFFLTWVVLIEEISAHSSKIIEKFRGKREIGESFEFTGDSDAELSLTNEREWETPSKNGLYKEENSMFLSFFPNLGSTYRRDIGSLFENHWEIQRETGNWREFWVHGRFRRRALSHKWTEMGISK